MQQQLSCQSKSEESCCWLSTRQHVFGNAGSTFVTTERTFLEKGIKVLRRSAINNQQSAVSHNLFTATDAKGAKE